MGTTSLYGFPYPDGTDLVISGDDAMQALAEYLEERLTPSHASASVTGPGPDPVTTAAGLELGTITGSSEFTITGVGGGAEGFLYDGPSRWHLVNAYVGCYGVDTDATFDLGINGGVVRQIKHDGGSGSTYYTLSATGAFLLADGDVISLGLGSTGGVVVNGGVLQVISLAPGQV